MRRGETGSLSILSLAWTWGLEYQFLTTHIWVNFSQYLLTASSTQTRLVTICAGLKINVSHPSSSFANILGWFSESLVVVKALSSEEKLAQIWDICFQGTPALFPGQLANFVSASPAPQNRKSRNRCKFNPFSQFSLTKRLKLIEAFDEERQIEKGSER